jgi:hypothetical protein
MDTQHGYEAQKFRKDMEHKKRHGKTAGTRTLLIQTLAFPSAEWFGLWNRVSSVGQQREEKRKFGLFSFALGTFAIFSCSCALFCFALTSVKALLCEKV